jgi:ubiquinone/menaquinone biosynthesis C-methylase UbiE
MDFEDTVGRYESWYGTREGRRADRLEKALLDKLLKRLSCVKTVLEVGCGTGHFTRWLAERGIEAVGLDISPAMLAQARRLEAPARCCPYVRGDGLALPFPDRAFDLVALITTLEFVPQPGRVLADAGRVARHGILMGGLNRYSPLALQRRWRSLRTPTITSRARCFTVRELERLARNVLMERLRDMTWRTTLLPGLWPCTDTRLPWGGFVGMFLELEAEGHG